MVKKNHQSSSFDVAVAVAVIVPDASFRFFVPSRRVGTIFESCLLPFSLSLSLCVCVSL